MTATKNITNSKEAKVIPLYNEPHATESSGSFTCPAVSLIHALSTEVKSLKQLLVKQNPNSSERLDNSDLLREYKISRGTAVSWRNSGLSYTKVGSKIYYERENIDSFLRKHNVKAF